MIDDRLIDAAPGRLNRSGVGDAIAIWSAPADWLLACSVGMDGPFPPEAVDPVVAAVERLADPDPAVARAALVESLTVGGQMIGVANSTAPLSGSEHLVSHISWPKNAIFRSALVGTASETAPNALVPRPSCGLHRVA